MKPHAASALAPLLAAAAAVLVSLVPRPAHALAFLRSDVPAGLDDAIAIDAGDFDEDGLPDLVLAGLGGEVALLRNTGTSFVALPPIAVGTFPTLFWVSAVDEDNDGHEDVVAADLGSDLLYVLRGDGTGALTAAGTITVGQGPIHVSAADLDQDLLTDLVVCNSASPFLTVLYGTGARLDLPVPFQSHTTALRDYDEDGRIDIAVSFEAPEEVGVLLASPASGFFPYVSFGTSFGYHMDAGDFDGDGHQDLVTAPAFLTEVHVLMGNGNGTFTPHVVETVGSLQNDVRVADLDCDGLDDAVVVGPSFSRIYLGSSALDLVPTQTLASGPSSTSVAPADYDGDGVVDLAMPEFVPASAAAVFSNLTVFLWCDPAASIDPGPQCVVDLSPRTCDTTLVITSQPPLPAALPPGVHAIAFTAVDPIGQTATCTTLLTVLDSTAPVIVNVPPDATVECPAVPPPASPGVVDCDPAATLTLVETLVGGPCPDAYTVSRTWTASDSSGNTATATQVVSVVDVTPPVITGCAFEPLPAAPPSPPASPASPAAPASPQSCTSEALVRVRCGTASDACNPAPAVAAELVVRRHHRQGTACMEVEDVFPAACDEPLRLRLVAAPCAARHPRSPRPPVQVGSDGIRIVTGEEITLRVTAQDRCGNASQPCTAAATSSFPAPCP